MPYIRHTPVPKVRHRVLHNNKEHTNTSKSFIYSTLLIIQPLLTCYEWTHESLNLTNQIMKSNACKSIAVHQT